MKKDKYAYEGKEYVILGFTMVKCPVTRAWFKAVKYIQLETGLDFAREEKEFFERFKLVE